MSMRHCYGQLNDLNTTTMNDRYLESWGGSRFSNHFLVTGQEGRDTERLESRGAVYVFRTTE